MAIGFRVNSLERATFKAKPFRRGDNQKSMSARLCKVKYLGPNSLESDIDSEIDEMAREADSEFNRLCKQLDWDACASMDFRGAVFAGITRMRASTRKHESFSNECEYRLLAEPLGIDVDELKFRPVRSTLVPYIELSIPTTDLSPHEKRRPHQDFIAEAVIGPTPNEDLSVQAVQAFFRKHKMLVDIQPSRIPYRDF